MITLELKRMATDEDPSRVDVYIDGSYVGEIGLSPGEWDRLLEAHNRGEIQLEVSKSATD